eukprot:CAMPEP_0204511154 /NCGR_PEP_ID=MMETSP0661-20131031/275_1 /ASSEMBLY_ACC=CAM_ASM_000606 /TAXON_ID=109239 /ORGANISM="Alexandrium margalefi, Strain AMGDE01CS-322" /LENGTH=693 /DNA_ID=CAMNT_0051516225 /DNA_START=26 /DNA_END=2107 /DNA_ORIENTATION=-
MPPLPGRIVVAREPGGGFVGAKWLLQQSRHDRVGGIEPKAPPPPRSTRGVQQGSTEYGDVKSQLQAMEDPGLVTVKVNGQDVSIFVDPDKGPRWGQAPDDFVKLPEVALNLHADKTWLGMTMDEKQIFLIRLAKKFSFLGWSGADIKADDGEEDDTLEMTHEEIEAAERENVARRCQTEMGKPAARWNTITIDTVTANHRRRAPGMFYHMEFPWTESMLIEMGPEWLTKAFQAAGTLGFDNRVVKIIQLKKNKITTGNNGGKFLFDVKYARKRPGLHTRLFAKVPFPLEGVTRSDRLSSSVNKQPQEFYEINTSRLLESALPVKIPKYYFGDISNETSNFIIISEAVLFADPEPLNFGPPFAKRRRRLEAYAVEGPYDKCMDHTLRGKPTVYYKLLVTTGAKIAGMHRAGKLGPEDLLRASFGDMADKSAQFFGLAVGAPSGDDPRAVKPKLDTAQAFLHDTGRALFPGYVTEEWCSGKLRDLMLSVNSYGGEIMYWKHMNPDYVALTHCNLNVDNAYFWRNADNKLDIGIFDWGNMGSMSLGHKLWWWLYCSDFENFQENLDMYLTVFADSYHEHGGPVLDTGLLRWQVIMTAMEQMLNLMFAVPQIFKMCPKHEWPSIENRYDPRISENIDGKSTLRLYLHVLNSIIRIIEEMQGAEMFQRFIDEVWVGQFKIPPKPYDIVQGNVKTGMGL